MKRNFLLIILSIVCFGNVAFGQISIPNANLQASIASPTSVLLSWVSQNSIYTQNVILNYREISSPTNAWTSQTLANTATSWTHTGVVSGKSYEYSIQLVINSVSPAVITPSPPATSGTLYASITIPAPPPVVTTPANPTNLFIDLARATSNSLYMTWTDNATNEEGFEIRFSTDGVNFGNILIPGANRNSYTLMGLFPNTPYVIEVKAYNRVGTLFSNASRAGGTTLKLAPTAVQSLTAIETCVNDAKIFWTQPNMQNIEEIWVERSSDNVTFFREKTLSPNHISTVGYYAATGLPENAGVFYRIRAVNNLGNPNSGNRGEAVSSVIRIQTKQAVGPFPPNSLRVVSKTDKSVTYTWENRYDNIDNVCKTNVRTANHLKVWIDGKPVIVENNSYNGQRLILGPDDKTFTLTGLNPKSEITFGVYAVNGVFNRDSEVITVKTTTFGPPAAPTNLATQPGNDIFSNPNIFMSWKDNSDDEDNFIVEASTDPNTLRSVVKYAPNVNFFTHIPVDEGVTWYYRVYAENVYGISGYSDVISGMVDYSKAPESPYDAKGALVSGKPNITWKDFSQREESFEIERSSDAGAAFAKIGTAKRNVLAFRDSTAAAGKSYQYRIKAVNPKGSSAYTNVVTVAVPATTTGFSLENLVSISPNPTAGNLRVSLPPSIAEESGVISVFDQSQRLLFRSEFDAASPEHNFDISKAKEGMYLVVITTETQKISKRLFKQQ